MTGVIGRAQALAGGAAMRRGVARLRRMAVPRIGPAVLAAALLAAGCGEGTKIEEVSLATRVDAIEVEVKTRIGPAVCSVDADCRALPMGALPCGGPSRFLPYSIRGTDEGALSRLSADHQRLSAELLAGQQAVGNCLALLQPVAYCELGAPLACKLR
ncbi:MAG: hypothetical protein RJA99_2395 [Pseudomonadota bacterium]